MKEQEQQPGIEGIAIAQVWALAIQLPLRQRIGRNVLGFQAVFALLLLVFWAGLAVSAPVALWMCIYFFSVICHRIATIRRRGREDEPHTYYNGYPWLGKLFPFISDEVQLKAIVEPAVALGLAFVGAAFDKGAGLFFLGGAVCMVLTTGWTELKHRKRMDDVRDAVIEGKMYRPANRRRW
jgi:hypothetical protein